MLHSPLKMNLPPGSRWNSGDARPLHTLLPGMHDSLDQLRQRVEGLESGSLTPEMVEMLRQDWRKLEETFEFSGLFGAAYAASQAIMALSDCHHPEAFTQSLGDALAGLLIVLPAYVDLMARGETDCPTLLLYPINALRLAVSRGAIGASEIFASTGGAALIEMAGPEPAQQDHSVVKALAERYRPGVMHAIWLVLRERGDARVLASLMRVAEKLEHAATTAAVARSWWILRSLVVALSDHAVSQTEVRPILLRLERLLGGLMRSGETPEQCQLHCHTAAQALYVLGRAQHLAGLPAEVAQAYDLIHCVISPEQQERLQCALGDVGSHALSGIAASIRDELQVVKESLDVISRTPQPAADELKVLVGVTQSLCATLAILDRRDLTAHLDGVATKLAAWATGGQVIETEWPEVAQSVLVVEEALASLSAQSDRSEPEPVVSELQRAVVQEVLSDLHQCIAALENRSSGSTTADEAVRLNQMASALAVAGLAEVSYGFNQLAQALPLLTQAQTNQEIVANALQSLMLYLEGWCEQSADANMLKAALEQTGQLKPLLAPSAHMTAEHPIHATPDAALHADLCEIFAEEAEEIMAQIGPAQSRWRADLQDREALTHLRRGFHTLKGSGRMVGALAIGELAWSVERLLNQILEGSRQADEDTVISVAHAIEQIDIHLHDLQQPLSAAGQECIDRLTALFNGKTVGLAALPGTATLTASHVKDDEASSRPAPADPATSDSALIPAEAREAKETEAESAIHLASEDLEDSHAESTETSLLIDLFEQEAAGYLDRLQSYLQEAKGGDILALDPNVLSVFHTMKGTARTVHKESLAQKTSALDQWVKAVLKAGKPLLPSQVELLARGVAACRLAVTTESGDDEDIQWLELLARDREDVERRALAEAGKDIDPEMRAVFLEEAVDLLAHIDLLLGEHADGSLRLDALMGDLHTFKGGARMTGALPLGDLAHAIESFLGRMGSDDAHLEPESHSLLRQALDTLQEQLDQWAEGLPTVVPSNLLESLAGGSTDSDDGLEAAVKAAAMADGDPSPDPASAIPGEVMPPDQAPQDFSRTSLEVLFTEENSIAAMPVQPPIDPGALPVPLPEWWAQPLPGESEEAAVGNEQIRVSAQTLDRLLSLIGELMVVNGRVEQPVRELASYAREIARTIDRLRRQLRELELEAESRIVFQHASQAEDAPTRGFDPLEMDRYTRLQQLSRALSESVSDLVSLQELVSGQQQTSEAALQVQRSLAGELQHELLRTRMIAFEFHGARLRRIVRQTAEALDKQAMLEIIGGETELDRQVLDRMIAPLDHLLRNALAHGIEPPEERVRLGKSAQGQITVRVSREGSQVLLEIADDGRGLNAAAILERARARGLVERDEQLSETQIFHLILAPGLSTAEQVSQIAGRGVGMDVVNSQIKACGGRLEIASEQGQGSKFRIWLPYTIAITDCLLLSVGAERYAVPMAGVQGVMRLDADQLSAWREGRLTRLQHLGMDYRLQDLTFLLGASEVGQVKPDGECPALLLSVAGQRWALVADSLLGTQEVVVRPVGTRVASMPGISGATLLSDGGVILILDLQSLLDIRGSLISATRPQAHQIERAASPLRVMVVDDSITVRRVTARLLEHNGMIAVTARDGVDALQKIQDQLPDLVLLDVEMPRMDGFELLANLKSNADLQHIPVVMITSRTGDKHRHRALDLGAAAYLGKPFQETELLETLARLTRAQQDVLPAEVMH